MIAIPAVDVREGACVQLVGGVPGDERVRMPDPVAAAEGWARLGFRRLHVVDLDAALGTGSNAPTIRAVVAASAIPAQVGGGVRGDADITDWLAAGAASVIIGTRALEEPEWLEGIAWRHPGRLVVAADVRERAVVVRGWTRALRLDIRAALHTLAPLPLAGVLVTAVHREGQMRGPDVRLVDLVVREFAAPVYAAGGVGSLRDLDRLAGAGVAGVVIGMALYTGALDARTVAEAFGGGQ